MKRLAIIPAKDKSVRVKKKNFIIINKKPIYKYTLNNLINSRAKALFDVNKFALARFHKTLRVWWLRGLQIKKDCESQTSSLDLFLKYLHWNNDLGMNAFDTCENSGPFPSVKRVLHKHTTNKTKK